MSAPALVLLAHGSTRPVVSEVIREMRAHMQSWHPNIGVHIAFIDHEHPTAMRVLGRLARRGVDEAVLVPLNLANLFSTSPRIDEVVTEAAEQFPELSLRIARPVGPEASLLTLVDQRLREALAECHATELDGLVLATEESTDSRSHGLLARRARQWSLHHKLPVVIASGSVDSAVAQLRKEGRRHVAVGALFLTAYEAYEQCRAEAQEAGATAIGAPIGFASEVCDLVFGRYSVAAMDLVDFDFITDDETTTEDDEAPAGSRLTVVGA